MAAVLVPLSAYVATLPILHAELGSPVLAIGFLLILWSAWVEGIVAGVVVAVVHVTVALLHLYADGVESWGDPNVSSAILGTPFLLASAAGVGAARQLAARFDAQARDLATQRQILDNVLGAAPVVIFGFDRDGVLFLSEGKEPLLGPAETMPRVGDSVFDFPGAPPPFIAACRRALAGEGSAVTFPLGDKLIEQRLRPWIEGGEVVAVLGTAHEVTGELQTATLRAFHAEEVALLTDASPDLISRWDRDLRRTYANPAALRVTKAGDALQLGDCMSPEVAAVWARKLRNVLGGEPEERFEFILPTPEGDKTFETRLVPQRGPGGTISSALAVCRDVTEQRLISSRLAESERRFRLMVQRSSDIVSVVGVDGRFTYVSEAVVGVLGYAPEELVGQLAVDLIHPDDRQASAEKLALVFSRKVGEPLRQRYRYRRKDGAWCVLESTGAAYVDDPVIGGVILNSRDVTAEVAALERERATQTAMELITHNLSEIFYMIELDPFPHQVWVSEGWTRLTGQPVATLLASPERWVDPIVAEDRALLIPEGWESNGFDARYRVHGADGTIHWVHSRAVPLPVEPGRPRRLVGVTEDITKQRLADAARDEAEERLRRIEQLEAISRFKTTLLNTAAHELATPLTPILFEVESLRAALEGRLTDDDRRAFALLSRNLDRLARLINDLLDAARIQRGALALRPGPADVAAIARDVASTFTSEAARAHIELTVEAPHALSARADAQRLTQVLTNLVSNAIKFTPAGGHVVIEVVSHEGDAILRVKDTGIGLTTEQIGRLFQPFTQVHDPAKVKAGGTGLGLYVSLGIIQQHGGTLEVRSDGLDRGSTFEARIPLAGPPGTPRVAETAPVAT